MKKLTLMAAAAASLVACNNAKETKKETTLTSNIDSVSYAIGTSQAKGLLGQVKTLNVQAFLAGFEDATDSSKTLKIADADVNPLLQAFSQKMQQEQQAQAEKASEGTYQEGLAFLEENKKNPEVKVTASGLQYIVIKEGTGAQPTATSNVEVHYHGTTPDGTVFDSSVDRGEPISFGLNQVIKGWTEGVQLMKEGAKYKFFVPQELAYGANPPQGGQGPIKAKMPLVFEVELIKINK